jgi:hypothetical protein
MMKSTTPNAFTFAANIAAAWEGKDSAGLHKDAGLADALTSSIPYREELFKIAAAAFEGSGRPGEFLFTELSKNASAPGAELFADVVLRALGSVEKKAFPIVAAAHDKLGGSVLRTLVSAGILGGAGAGSLAFLLNRNATQGSADNAQLLEKIRTFNELKQEIEEDQRMKEMEQRNKKEVSSGRFNIR